MPSAPPHLAHPEYAQHRLRGGTISWLPLAFATLVSVLVGGCQTKPYCEPLSRCGGDFLDGGKPNVEGHIAKEWVATADETCTDQVQPPVNIIQLSQQPSRTAGSKPTGNATYDWCQNLEQFSNGLLEVTSIFPTIPARNATLEFEADGSYHAHFLNYQPLQMQFSAACRAAQGINQSCPALGRGIRAATAAESNVTNMRCADDGEGGCLCDYELKLFTSLVGSWEASGGILTFYDQTLAPNTAAPVDYCVKGERLELTGHEGQQLFNRPALRTLNMRPVSCEDGVQDQGEDGVDCSTPPEPPKEGQVAKPPGPCSKPCPTCRDGIQNGDETGPDCGGSCKDMCECYNGVKDSFEDGVDCGGPCALLCSCTNKVHDSNEAPGRPNAVPPVPEGVDCGGECNARYDGDPLPCDCGDECACFNGKLDEGEEGIDCGGPCALLCSCKNGYYDGNEERADCGGDCRETAGGEVIACK